MKVSAVIEIIEHPALKPRRIPSRSWRELIKKVCEVDPLLCRSMSPRDTYRVADQRRADHRAHLAKHGAAGGGMNGVGGGLRGEWMV